MTNSKVLLNTNENTILTEFIPKKKNKEHYQTEAELEKSFVNDLSNLGYQYLPLDNNQDLKENIKRCIERLNNITFTTQEFEKFYQEHIANPNLTKIDKTTTIQKDYIKNFTFDNGDNKNIYLLKTDNLSQNKLQVINQYKAQNGQNRYDVTILLNGLPIVQIELKKRDVNIKQAFEQTIRYKNTSFNFDDKLFEYVQIFVISNGTYTKYYSNSILEKDYQFTNNWADEKNQPIDDIEDFTETFFNQHTLLNVLTKYCVFDTKQNLLVMRPYQIAAAEKIINKINFAYNNKKQGSKEANGYIWHTTGSGKTLTSFKTAQLATKLPFIDKVLFVVDRKDLDLQTQKEYERFEKGSSTDTKNANKLKQNLENPENKIIITTIQKLSIFVERNKEHEVFNKNVVFIFDEAHRTQFGKMHTSITKKFKNYYLYGFTGTPIFKENSQDGKTTELLFNEKLHTYTIIDATNDKNVLPFRVDYYATFKKKEDIEDEEVEAINVGGVYHSKENKQEIVKYILSEYNKKTDNQKFNTMFAVSSVDDAIEYYDLLKDNDLNLKVATIFSNVVEDESYIKPATVKEQQENKSDGIEDENNESMEDLEASKRAKLNEVIQNFNNYFNDRNSDDFENIKEDDFKTYYEHLSEKVKQTKIDILIVVNMFLTGFDAPKLNTIFIDKNLKYHGLIQAFSRTNRIYDTSKSYGNVVCFNRPNRQTVDDAVKIFGDKENSGFMIMEPFEQILERFKEKVEVFQNKFPHPEKIIDDKTAPEDKKEFVKTFNEIKKIEKLLNSFPEFTEEIKGEIINEGDLQTLQGIYLELRTITTNESNAIDILNDIEFEISLITSINIDVRYILNLIQKERTEDNEIDVDKVLRQVSADPTLHSKKELIERFLHLVKGQQEIDIFEAWESFVSQEALKEFLELVQTENLNEDKSKTFIKNAFNSGNIDFNGSQFVELFKQKANPFVKENNFETQKNKAKSKLQTFFDNFFGAVENIFK